mgnify:CR=1 FL=1
MYISPAVVNHILPVPFVPPPQVGVVAPGPDACPILADTTYSSAVTDVAVPMTS